MAQPRRRAGIWELLISLDVIKVSFPYTHRPFQTAPGAGGGAPCSTGHAGAALGSNDHQCRASTLSGRRGCVGPSQSWVTSTFPSCARPSCAGRPVSATDLDTAERSVLLRYNISCLASSRLAVKVLVQLERARTAVSDGRRSPTALAEADRIGIPRFSDADQLQLPHTNTSRDPQIRPAAVVRRFGPELTEAVVCRLIALDAPDTHGLPWQPDRSNTGIIFALETGIA